MSKKALIVKGGWNGHDPDGVTRILSEKLTKKGMDVDVETRFEVLDDAETVANYDVVIPNWTMAADDVKQQTKALCEAVKTGVTNLAGLHGGMGDCARGNLGFEWMAGGMFVGHPHVGKYTVRLTGVESPITKGMPDSFQYNSEQYYMMVDPGNNVLAETTYEYEGKQVVMPVIWTKSWGEGRVFYSALGHKSCEFAEYPHVLDMTIRGILWAAGC